MDAERSEDLDRLLFCLSGLADVAAEIAVNPNLKGAMKAVLRMVQGTFTPSRAALVHCSPETRRFALLATVGIEERSERALRLDERAERYWCQEGAGIDVQGFSAEPELQGFMAQNAEALKGLPGALWLPLAIKGGFYGLLMLSERLDQRPYSETERELLTVIARQIALALHNHGLKFRLDLKVLELERLHEFSSVLHSTLNRASIAKELVSSAASLLNARRGLLATYDAETDRFEIEATLGLRAWEPGSRPSDAQAWLREASAGEGMSWDRPLDLPTELDSFTCLAVPLLARERMTGVLALFDKEAGMGIGSFSEEDRKLLLALTSQASVSFENARLYELATVDGLTKLYIRRHFEQRFAEEVRRALRYSSPLSLLMIDIDFFKKFNDTYGHATGDEVLRLVAKTIRSTVREDLDIPARYGGEEMMVLMPETDAEGAMRLAERVRAAVEAAELPGPNGEPLRVTVSLGVATLPEHAVTEDALMEFADQALYQSKHAGRNRVTLYGGAAASV